MSQSITRESFDPANLIHSVVDSHLATIEEITASLSRLDPGVGLILLAFVAGQVEALRGGDYSSRIALRASELGRERGGGSEPSAEVIQFPRTLQ